MLPGPAHLAAWVALGAVNALAVAGSGATTSLDTLLWAALYGIGPMAAAGLLSGGVAGAWRRLCAGGPVPWWTALWVVATAVGQLTLRDDLAGAAHRLLGGRASTLVLTLLVAVVCAAVPAGAWVGQRARSRGARGTIAALAVVLTGVNHLVLLRSYPGFHLMVLWMAASALAGALLACPVRVSPGARRITFDVARAGAAALGAWTIAVPPSPQTLALLLGHSGVALAPYVAAAHARVLPAPSYGGSDSPWFADRSHLPDVPSTEPPLVPSPVVLLLTIDAARWDLLADEHYRQALPTLHQLRDESVSFQRALAPGNETLSSLAALMTGKYASQLRWSPRRKGLGLWKRNLEHDRSVRFPQIIADAGIPTVLIAASAGLDERYGVCRGFTEVTRPGWYSDKIVAAAARRLERVGSAGLFLYAHFMDAHGPYDAAGLSGTPFERYLREIGLVDQQLGHLLTAIDAHGLRDRTIIIVTSDHGEAFGEHGSKDHGTTLYREQVQIPLLIRGPGVAPREVDDWVSLIDLGPTVLDLMGRPTPATFLGQSLVPYLRGRAEVVLRRPVAMQSAEGLSGMLLADRFKIIEDAPRGSVELYDLQSDPGEENNLFDPARESHRRHLGLLRSFFAARPPPR
jgi:hypothetical protein